MTYFNIVTILGVKFVNGSVDKVFDYLNENGGLLTAPAAPSMLSLTTDHVYYNALKNSDVVIPDSGFMVLSWNLISKEKIEKISGLKFINYFISHLNKLRFNSLFLVNPTELDTMINKQFFIQRGLAIPSDNLYTAPFYNGNIEDDILLSKIEAKKPFWVLINIGGGTQEQLGHYLRRNLSYRPAIICTGAAIAFKTGRQTHIPKWVDKLYLGWLARCISNPKVYIPRYMKGFKLLHLILKYGSKPIN
ncbi:WecB/TagA/CpsF family glycosyltransferase [Runella sp.]|uniref:WecB/TagA/CpsF family glycosyltransferase n=1 Tax=Runella sp. TaxID=1960881 RepID=UPI003D108B11